MKKFQIISMAVLLTASAGYSALLLDVNFEGQTAGSQPTGAAYIRPTANSSTQAVQVVNSTLLGGNQAVQVLDKAVNTGTATALQYNFASNGAVVASFSFSPSYTAGSSANFYEIGLGQQITLSSSTNIFCSVRLRADGSIGFVSAGNVINTRTNLAAGSSNTVSMVANDTASDIVYLGTTVAANTVNYYFNGSLVQSGSAFGTYVGTLGTTNGFGRFAIFDSTARVDLDYLVDNISVQAIPEPAAIGMLGLGALIILAVRRRRA